MKSMLLALAAALMTTVSAIAGEFPDITIAELKKAIEEKKAIVIDVNGSESYKEGHVPTALNYAEVKGKLDKVLPADKNALIVAYCGGPKCGAYAAAAKEAKKLGYTNVKHLSAGISGWREAGEKLETGESKSDAKKS